MRRRMRGVSAERGMNMTSFYIILIGVIIALIAFIISYKEDHPKKKTL